MKFYNLQLLCAFTALLQCKYLVALESKMIIDHDGGADDAMAIAIALIYEKYFNGPKVISLTTVHGNVDEKQAFVNSQRLLHQFNRRDVPIYRGSKSPFVAGYESDYYFGKDGLGDNGNVTYEPIEAQPHHAAVGLIELSKKHEGNLSIVTIASLTNIALAIKLDPSFINRLSQLYIAAGYVYSDKYPDGEFNAAMDVEAYHVVMEAASVDKVTVIPFSQIYESFNHTDRAWRKSVLGAIPTQTMRALNDYEEASLLKRNIWVNLDPIAMSLVLKRDLIEKVKYSQNGILLCGIKRGTNTNNFTFKKNANSKVIYAMNENAIRQFLLAVFSAEINT